VKNATVTGTLPLQDTKGNELGERPASRMTFDDVNDLVLGDIIKIEELAVTGYRLEWFFPAAMVIVGAHYLPFVFLYGMRHYAALAAILAFGGVGLALWGPESFSLGAWITGLVLVSFAFLLRASVRTEVATNTQGAPDPPGRSR
jgi:hypothetical protein